MRQDELMEQNDSMKVTREIWHTPVEMHKQHNIVSTTGGPFSNSQLCSSEEKKQLKFNKVDHEMMSCSTVAGWDEKDESKKVDRISSEQLSLLSLVFNHKQLVDYNTIIQELRVPPCEYKESKNEGSPEEPVLKEFSRYSVDMQMSQETNTIDDKDDDISKTSLIFINNGYNNRCVNNDSVISIESLSGTFCSRQNEIFDEIKVAILCNDFGSSSTGSILPSSVKESVSVLGGAKLDGYMLFGKCLKSLSPMLLLAVSDDDSTCSTKRRTKLSKFTRGIRARMRRRAEERREELYESDESDRK